MLEKFVAIELLNVFVELNGSNEGAGSLASRAEVFVPSEVEESLRDNTPCWSGDDLGQSLHHRQAL